MNGRKQARSWEEILGDLDWTLRNAGPRLGQRANPRVDCRRASRSASQVRDGVDVQTLEDRGIDEHLRGRVRPGAHRLRACNARRGGHGRSRHVPLPGAGGRRGRPPGGGLRLHGRRHLGVAGGDPRAVARPAVGLSREGADRGGLERGRRADAAAHRRRPLRLRRDPSGREGPESPATDRPGRVRIAPRHPTASVPRATGTPTSNRSISGFAKQFDLLAGDTPRRLELTDKFLVQLDDAQSFLAETERCLRDAETALAVFSGGGRMPKVSPDARAFSHRLGEFISVVLEYEAKLLDNPTPKSGSVSVDDDGEALPESKPRGRRPDRGASRARNIEASKKNSVSSEARGTPTYKVPYRTSDSHEAPSTTKVVRSVSLPVGPPGRGLTTPAARSDARCCSSRRAERHLRWRRLLWAKPHGGATRSPRHRDAGRLGPHLLGRVVRRRRLARAHPLRPATERSRLRGNWATQSLAGTMWLGLVPRRSQVALPIRTASGLVLPALSIPPGSRDLRSPALDSRSLRRCGYSSTGPCRSA